MVFKVIKPLYGLAELDIEISRYNLCLLITKLGKLFSLPEAVFDFAAAAQELQPARLEIEAINKHIQYICIKLERARLYVFVDGSFANNKDLKQPNGFEVIGNVIYWSSTKCKRVIRSILASEIYGITAGFDIGYVLNHMLALELVICIDLRSIVEKRLIIDLIALCQSYEALDAITKALPNKALEMLILTNKAIFRVKG
ncbi:hypothetical protein GQ53DRAFT_780132 [Thozetella sp. PMI_491]|nr:hypothetical protein GQ53DRAFT_780132 [Thozetella sp. PMI_491]